MYPADTLAAGFVPPTWADISVLLRSGCGLWLSLLLFACLRAAAAAFFTSHYFRRAARRTRARRAAPPTPGGAWSPAGGGGAARDAAREDAEALFEAAVVWAWRVWRDARAALVRFQRPEAMVARYFGLPRFCGGVVVCLLYIVESYMQGIPTHYWVFQAVYGAAVGGKLLLGFVYANRPFVYIFRLSTLLDCLSVPSLMLARNALWLNFNFLQAFSGVLMEWALLEKYDIVLLNYPTLARLLVNLVLQLLVFLFITSCGIQQFELLGDPGERLASETFQITWANSVYFAVVTLMTVGYGDFVPYTLMGRMWIVFHIIFAAYLISREISLLIDALKSMRRGDGSFVRTAGNDHVVVTGHIKWEFLVQFVKEFLVETEHLDVKIVILASNDGEWTDEDQAKYLQSSPFFDHHLIFLEGSPLKTEDLARARVEAASGVFVLADPHRKDPYLEDSDTLKALLTVRNFAAEVPIYTINALHDSSFQFKIAMEQVNIRDAALLASGVPSSTAITNFDLASSRTYNTFMHLIPPTPAPTNDPIFGSSDFDHAPSAQRKTPAPNVLDNTFNMSSMSAAATGGAGASSHGPGRFGMARIGSAYNGEFNPRDDDMATTPNAHGVSLPAAGTPKRRQRGPASCESLCMQKLEMALLSESVFCNGLSTLITNLAMRQQPKSRESDPPWLREYMVGSECCIRFCRMPNSFHGKRLGDVALPLYDYGMVMLAVRRSSGHNWRLVHTNTIMDTEMTAAVLTYHEECVTEKIVEHANQFVLDREKKEAAEAAAQAADDELSPRVGVAGSMHSMEMDGVIGALEEPGGEELDEETNGVPFASSGSAVPAEEVDDFLLGSLRSSPPYPGLHQSKHPSGFTPKPLGSGPSPLSTALRAKVPPLAPLPISLASSGIAPRPFEERQQLDLGIGAGVSSVQNPNRIGNESTSRQGRGRTMYSSDEDDGNRCESRGADAQSHERPGTRLEEDIVSSTGVPLPIYGKRDSLPAHLSGHIIVCLDGEHTLINLDFLLRRIWTQRKGQKKRTPVVVIHPRFPKNFEREVPRGKGSSDLFLLRGNSLSEETLKQAQFQSSCSILIMSSEPSASSSSRGSTDSEAIFTVMTLDSLLNDNANTFVCCMLDAVGSLQLLLSPRRSRRRGVNLGEQREASILYRDRSAVRGSASFHQLAQRTVSQASLRNSVRTPTSPYVTFLSSGPGRLDEGITAYGSASFGHGIRRRNNIPRTTSMAFALRQGAGPSPLTRSVSMARFGPEETRADDEEEHFAEESRVETLRAQHRTQQGVREESAEGQRFASGEMMISSFFAGLLVREYVESGFVQLLREMIGTGAQTRKSWVRQVDVPVSWVDESDSDDGRTYRDVVERLLKLGCMPMGLYRSGDAPVRMPDDEEVAEADRGSLPGSDSGSESHSSADDLEHYTRTFSELASAPFLRGSYLSLHDEMHGLRGNSADFGDEMGMVYDCPTTKRRIRYMEASGGGENVLPYVYTNPEPFTLVAGSDAVFVLCPPETSIPVNWALT